MSSSPGSPLDPAASAPTRSPGEPLPDGAELGRFTIVRLAGVGGMGEVYQAWDALLERSVALKSVLPLAGEDGSHLARFRWEARALAQLSHPHICQIYDLVTLGAETFIAMEWLEGETLEAAGSHLDLPGKVRTLRAIAEGMAYAHGKLLVHRDLKPANVMVMADGGVKILDFGLARLGQAAGEVPVAGQDRLPGLASQALGSMVKGGDLATACEGDPTWKPGDPSGRSEVVTRQGMFMGSPRYASPEQIQGELAGAPSDVWSLGLLAWELLLGSNPFPGEGSSRLLKVLNGKRDSTRGKGLSRRLAALLESMLAMEPAARPTAEAVARILAKELQPRHTAWWVASQAAILVLAVGGMYLLFGRGVAADLTKRTPARLAIYPAVDQTGTPKGVNLARHLLPDLLGAGLRNVERLRVVDPEDLGRAAKRLHLPLVQAPSEPVMEKVAAAVGAKLFLATALHMEAGRAVLTVELRDGAGRVRFRTQANAAATEASLPTVCLQLAQAAARNIAKAMDPLSPAQAEPFPLLDQGTLDRYAQAKAMVEGSDFKGAEPLFREVAYQYPAFSPGVKGYARCLAKTGSQPAEPVFMWARTAAKAQGYLAEELHILQYQIAHLIEKGERDRAVSLCREGLRLARPRGSASTGACFITRWAASCRPRTGPPKPRPATPRPWPAWWRPKIPKES